MAAERDLRAALGELAGESVGTQPADQVRARAAAGRAVRRARQRRAARLGVPALAVLVVAGVAGVAFRTSGSSNRVATAGQPRNAPAATAAPPSTATRSAGPVVPAGAQVLSRPVTVDGWTITIVPTGTYLDATTATIADFGPIGAGCAGKPAVAVTVLDHPTTTVDAELRQPTVAATAVPVPVAGTTGVEEAPAAGSACPGERFVLYQPQPGTLIQIATTTTGAAGAQAVAQGIKPAT